MIIIGTLIAAVLSLVMAIMSLLMACEGFAGILLVTFLIVVIAEIIKKISSPKGSPGKEEIKNEEPIYYRYRIYDMSKKKVIAMTNDYQRAFIMKRQFGKLGKSVMIQDDWGFKNDRKNVSNCRKMF